MAQVLLDVTTKAKEDAREYGCYGDTTSIFDDEMLTDIKALTWTISNMSRGGFYTADYWSKVELYIYIYMCVCVCVFVCVFVDGMTYKNILLLFYLNCSI